MKKILFIALIAMGCSEEDDQPVFRIEDEGKLFTNGAWLTDRFQLFEDMATERGVSINKTNLIFRWMDDVNPSLNDSKSYTVGEQLYVEIDEHFLKANAMQDDLIFNTIIFQQLAHGLVGTDWRDCGVMLRIITTQDAYRDLQNLNYDALFDSNAPC